jgi:hypothetical protein
LTTAQKYIEFQTNKLKNQIMSSVIANKILQLDRWLQGLLALSLAGLVVSSIAIGLGV